MPLPIPNVASLAGVGFHGQAAVHDPARSLFGTFTVTGAVQVTIEQ